MNVIVVCEFSGIVRDAFIKQGHNAISCDLLPSELPGPHIQGDCKNIDYTKYDLAICHPPCTHLAVSGARWFKEKQKEQKEALEFVDFLFNIPVPRFCLENPVSIISTVFRKPNQIIQPWQFGHPESKKTCLWLRGLPLLVPTEIVEPEYYKNPDGTDYKDKGGNRYSKTHYYSGRMQKRWLNQTPSGQNNLGPSPDRWKIRSRTYTGIAEAMAKQWGGL